jgi:hypothetical protein
MIMDWLAIWFYFGIAVVIWYAGREVYRSLRDDEFERESQTRANIYELLEMKRDKERRQ